MTGYLLYAAAATWVAFLLLCADFIHEALVDRRRRDTLRITAPLPPQVDLTPPLLRIGRSPLTMNHGWPPRQSPTDLADTVAARPLHYSPDLSDTMVAYLPRHAAAVLADRPHLRGFAICQRLVDERELMAA